MVFHHRQSTKFFHMLFSLNSTWLPCTAAPTPRHLAQFPSSFSLRGTASVTLEPNNILRLLCFTFPPTTNIWCGYYDGESQRKRDKFVSFYDFAFLLRLCFVLHEPRTEAPHLHQQYLVFGKYIKFTYIIRIQYYSWDKADEKDRKFGRSKWGKALRVPTIT